MMIINQSTILPGHAVGMHGAECASAVEAEARVDVPEHGAPSALRRRCCQRESGARSLPQHAPAFVHRFGSLRCPLLRKCCCALRSCVPPRKLSVVWSWQGDTLSQYCVSHSAIRYLSTARYAISVLRVTCGTVVLRVGHAVSVPQRYRSTACRIRHTLSQYCTTPTLCRYRTEHALSQYRMPHALSTKHSIAHA
eukprot:92414-Rhodomonas_salina.1